MTLIQGVAMIEGTPPEFQIVQSPFGGTLAFIPVVLLADPIQMQRNPFTLGNGYTVWTDAIVGQVVMLSPILAYEGTLRGRWKHAPLLIGRPHETLIT
jgi:hypothetical protein